MNTAKNKTKKPKKRHPLRKTVSSPFNQGAGSTAKKNRKTSLKTDGNKKSSKPKPLPELNPKQYQYLKAKAHHLKPLVIVGEKGITEAINKAVSEALDYHELIKVRLREPEDKNSMADELARKTNSVMVALRGHTVILFRPKDEDSAYKLP